MIIFIMVFAMNIIPGANGQERNKSNEAGNYSLLTLDWITGKEISTTVLGNNPIFNTAGGLFIPLDENRIYVTGVFGPVMISKE